MALAEQVIDIVTEVDRVDYIQTCYKQCLAIVKSLKEQPGVSVGPDGPEDDQSKASKWKGIVRYLFRKNNDALVPTLSSYEKPPNLWDDYDNNSLHLATRYDCPELVGDIVRDIKHKHGERRLKLAWLMAETGAGQTVLSIAIFRFDLKSVKLFISEAPELLQKGWTQYQKYPLHDLAIELGKWKTDADDNRNIDNCTKILREIVQADKTTLTAKCKRSYDHEEGTPFSVTKRLCDNPSAQPEQLKNLAEEMEDLSLRYLIGDQKIIALNLNHGKSLKFIYDTLAID